MSEMIKKCDTFFNCLLLTMTVSHGSAFGNQ